MCMLSHFSHVLLFATPWTVAHLDSLSMGFWSGLPASPPGDLPNPGTEPSSFMSPALAGRFFTTSTTWEIQGHNVPHDKYNEHWNILHTKVKRINHALLVGMQNGSATMKNGLMLPQKVKYRITIWFSNSIPRYIPRGIENRTQTDNCTPCSQQYYLQ